MARLPHVIESRDARTARTLLRQYLSVSDTGGPNFTGSWFDVLDRLDGDEDTDRLTADDIVAAHLVGATMPPHTVLALLTRTGDRISDLLAAIPADLTLCRAGADDIGPDSPLGRLRELISSTSDGATAVATTKLLARKRPCLVPIWDAGIFQATGVGADGYHEWVRQLVTANDCALWHWLQEQATALPEAHHLSPLRVLDILLWTSTWSEHHWPRSGAEGEPAAS